MIWYFSEKYPFLALEGKWVPIVLIWYCLYSVFPTIFDCLYIFGKLHHSFSQTSICKIPKKQLQSYFIHQISWPHWQNLWNRGYSFFCFSVRHVRRGVCFRTLNECNNHEDCPQNEKCCHQHCCPTEYFDKWKEMRCLSDEFCKNLHLGNAQVLNCISRNLSSKTPFCSGSSCCSQTQQCCDKVEEMAVLEDVDNVTSSIENLNEVIISGE